MNEGAEVGAVEPHEEVDGAQAGACVPPLLWIGQEQTPPRAFSSRTNKRVDIGVTTDNSVHDDDVVRFARLHDEVADAALDAVADASLRRELQRLFLVLAGELDVGGSLGPGREQLELDRANTAADLEDGRARH